MFKPELPSGSAAYGGGANAQNPRTPKTTPITNDYEISNTVLGLGINGKVVQCMNRKNGSKYALKVKLFKTLFFVKSLPSSFSSYSPSPKLLIFRIILFLC